MNRAGWSLAAVLALASPAADARVEGAGPGGFAASFEIVTPVAPAEAYAKFLRIGEWWSDAHSYSGAAANMTLDTARGGCWCESWPGGFVEHMAVTTAMPGRLLVLTGGLGPLQSMGVGGALSVAFTADGTGTRVTVRYVVDGFDPDGLDKMSGPVDAVLGEGVKRFAAFAARP